MDCMNIEWSLEGVARAAQVGEVLAPCFEERSAELALYVAAAVLIGIGLRCILFSRV